MSMRGGETANLNFSPIRPRYLPPHRIPGWDPADAMLHDLRQRRRGSVPCDPGEPPTLASRSTGPLLSTLDELSLAISTLPEQSQLHLLNELRDTLQRIQSSNYPPPPTHPQSTPPVSSIDSGLPSGPSKIGIFGGQVTFVNTIHNGEDAERTKHTEQLQHVIRMQYIQTGVFL